MSASFDLSDPLLRFLSEVNPPEPSALQAHRNQMPLGQAVLDPMREDESAFLSFLVRQLDVRLAVQVGGAAGYAALIAAQAVRQNAGPGGRVFAFTQTGAFTEAATSLWQSAGVESTVDCHLSPAPQGLNDLAQAGYLGRIDFVLVDRDFTNGLELYEQALSLLHTGGNLVFTGALSPTSGTQDIARFTREDQSVRSVVVTIGEGLLLVTKL
jgi:predicted O-methyltransferase YrrM